MAVTGVEVRNAVVVVAVTWITYKILRLLWIGLLEPLRLRRVMTKQGLKGPPFKFLVGNMLETGKFADSFPESRPLGKYADGGPTVTPQYALYSPKYGKNFVYQFATETRLVVRDPEMAKEIFVNNHAFLKQFPLMEMTTKEILGTGLVTLVGEKWANERRTLAPFFHQDALKGMVDAMVEATTSIVQKWEVMVTKGGGSTEIDVEHDIHKISTRIISLTAFGADWEKGEQVYELQTEFAEELFKSFLNPLTWIVPYYRKIPTTQNRRMDKCLAKMDALLLQTMNGRKEAKRNGRASSYGDDLLGRMLTAATDGWDEHSKAFNQASIYNNCKLFYFAGQDTVGNATTFALMLLANHPEWQDRARQEVLEVLGDKEEYNAGVFLRLKVVGMIVSETLRLFPPAPSMARQVTKDLQLKEVFIPKGLTVEIGSIAMQHDRDFWGEDVDDFNPARFSNGVSGACTHPQAFLPFGVGPKYCIGNAFALMEAKLVLAFILRRFQLLPSPNYKHYPVFTMGQKPKFGLPLILKAL